MTSLRALADAEEDAAASIGADGKTLLTKTGKTAINLGATPVKSR